MSALTAPYDLLIVDQFLAQRQFFLTFLKSGNKIKCFHNSFIIVAFLDRTSNNILPIISAKKLSSTKDTGRRGAIFPEAHQCLSRLALVGWRSLLGSLRRSDCAFLDAIASSHEKFGLVSLRFGYPVPSLIWVPVVSSLLVVPHCFCRAWLRILKTFYLHLISIWDTIRENKLSPWIEFLRDKPKGTTIKQTKFLVMNNVSHIEKALQAEALPRLSHATEGGDVA